MGGLKYLVVEGDIIYTIGIIKQAEAEYVETTSIARYETEE